MTNELVTINNTELPVKEYQGQRVVTMKDIDFVHKRPDGTARRNFNTNKEHLIEGADYFVRNSSEALTEFGIMAPNGLTLITESGYLMLVKSFTDDLAWSVQRQLVNTYFRATGRSDMVALPKDYPSALRALADQAEKNLALAAENEAQKQVIADYTPKVEYVDKILRSKGTLAVSQIAADYDMTPRELNNILHEEHIQHKVNGQWILYRKHMGMGYTRSIPIDITHRDGRPDTISHTQWTQKGRLFIHEILTRRGIMAVIDRKLAGEQLEI